ncbi:MAG: tRNA (guanosine(37)-N1)-methyltransferase TrmD [Gammaproteobacteria bacterium]|nr:tRNA (guanosine(37)-N1)-methyltransferase TrmD [Gammaproteobacteria bacterium]
MRFDAVSIFPEMFRALTGHGVTRRAFDSGLARLHLWNPRDFTDDPHRAVDDKPYGGGPGMVMSAPPLAAAIRRARADRADGAPVVLLSPQGERLDDAMVRRTAQGEGVIFLCGRYHGVDQRVIEAEVDSEWSLGDYVLSGGELAAMAVMDAVLRHLPGVVGNADSVSADSFAGGLLDHPHYTRPEDFAGRRAPAVLLGGDHEQVRRWRLEQAQERTRRLRPDLWNIHQTKTKTSE